jgi:hypothetical protein
VSALGVARLPVVGLVLMLPACASSHANIPLDSAARSGAALPARFVFDASLVTDTTYLVGCRSPLMDPADGTRLVLVRSARDGRGDYEVPPGHYGVGPNELLRINCRTDGIIGIVPR